MRRHLALSLVLLFAAAGSAFAGTEARLQGKILDAVSKQPIKDAVVNLESTEKMTVKQNSKVKADGTYALFVLDGTIRYKLTVSAPGYDNFVVETVKLSIGVSETKDIVLNKAGTAAGATGAAPAAAKPDPTVTAYNDGAALANAGDIPGAIAKFEEAVAAKPDLLAGWMALAKMQLRQKNYAKAIEAAGKVLEIDDSDADMLTVQYQAYTAQGDKANAAKIEPKLPKNAGSLFNEAAKLINSGNDSGAEKLLQQAVAIDEKFAQAHYELGMIYVRAGKSADAKAALTKYLEIDPNGKDAATAKEMMNYLK
ncbi:MAG TPA: tetratricopeptide repeat protein [Thermoanaerobaculia bacterium]|jgi:Tfp pilus assembly protein PilF|nr:tetratricopeptide repeat protein [Thermoanaerobaculia bacterium]